MRPLRKLRIEQMIRPMVFGPRMRLVLSTTAVAAVIAVALPSTAAVRRALLSVDGLAIPAGKSIFSYRIDTFGVVFLATCQMPQSWELKSEKYEDLEGYVSGHADLHGTPLRSLSNMYLVDVYDFRSRPSVDGSQPASFSGWVRIGARVAFGDRHGRKVRLRPSNVHLTQAKNCPVAPPPAP